MNNFYQIIIVLSLVTSIQACKENSKKAAIEPSLRVEKLIDKKNESTKATGVVSFFKEINNKKLIPLTIVNKDEEVYKKYQIDMYAVCMCDSQSMQINTKNNMLTIFDYCFGDMPNNKEILSQHTISKIVKEQDIIKVHLNTSEKELYLKITKTKDAKIYKMEIIGFYPFANRLKNYEYFSFLSDQKLFKQEDCEDFDG